MEPAYSGAHAPDYWACLPQVEGRLHAARKIPRDTTETPRSQKISKQILKKMYNAGEGVQKREPSYTVGGNANWCSDYGEQYGGVLKN